MNTTQGHTINSVQRTDTKLTDDQQDIVVRLLIRQVGYHHYLLVFVVTTNHKQITQVHDRAFDHTSSGTDESTHVILFFTVSSTEGEI